MHAQPAGRHAGCPRAFRCSRRTRRGARDECQSCAFGCLHRKRIERNSRSEADSRSLPRYENRNYDRHAGNHVLEQAKLAGADSFVYKNVGIEELLGIIRSTANGYSTFPNATQSIFSDASALNETEISILRLVCEAKTRKEIAAELYLSEGTVKRHISKILAKTGYDSILRLAVHAVSQGLIVPKMDK